MAVKVGKFTDLGAVLVEWYRAKSSNGIKHARFETRPWEIEFVNTGF